MKFFQTIVLLLCLLSLSAWQSVAAEVDESDIIRDLPYGEVLFDFYQQNYFLSLVNLVKAQNDKTIPQHASEAELLRGGLYLSYGMRTRAENIFKQVLSNEQSAEVRNRAYYYLARIAYQRGLLDQALVNLAKINDVLPEKLSGRDELMGAIIEIQQGKYREAFTRLDGWTGQDELRHYVAYNQGIAALRLGQTETGTDLLDLLGREKFAADNAELLALKDRANLAVGLHFLREESSSKAKPFLDRVRLTGPYSSKALLAAGWADARNEFYQPALIPWNELAGRNLLDPAVQESLFAIPYALASAGGLKQAAEAYQDALDIFKKEKSNIAEAISALENSDYLEILLSSAQDIEMGWLRELQVVEDAPHPWYLDELLASHRVQESLKNYRDLMFLDLNLQTWEESMDSFTNMVELRRQKHAALAPRAQAAMQAGAQENLQKKFAALNEIYLSADEKQKLRLLATPAELDKLARMDKLQEMIAAHPNAKAHDYLLRRVDFLKGILFWEIYNTLDNRNQRSRKELAALETEFEQSREFVANINQLLRALPSGFDGFVEKIESKRAGVSASRVKVDQLMAAQKEQLTQRVVAELTGHKNRIEELQIQAAFALAQIYDKDSEKELDEEEEQPRNRGVAR